MYFDRELIYFSTFTINNWIPVFQDFPTTNFIILDSLKFLQSNEKVKFYAFVLMKDHMHIVWQISPESNISDLSIKFKQFTGRKISKTISAIHKDYLENFQTERKDRIHKIWKLKSSHLRIEHIDILTKKINYIHQNPTKGEYKTVNSTEDYLFSSAKSYQQEYPNFSFLKLFEG